MQIKETKLFETVVAAFFLLLGVFLIVYTFTVDMSLAGIKMDASAVLYPRIVFSIMGFCSLCLLLRNIFTASKHSNDEADKKIDIKELFTKKTIISFLLVCGYSLLWSLIGFSGATLLYFIVQTKMIWREEKMIRLVLIAFGFVVFLNILFRTLFKIPFPDPIYDFISY